VNNNCNYADNPDIHCRKHREELVLDPTRAKSPISDGLTQEDRETDFFLVSTGGNTSRDPLHQALHTLIHVRIPG